MKKYVSIDIEASGPIPGKYSMLSLGACIVGEREKQFYRELQPLNDNFERDAMEIGCLGLETIKDLRQFGVFNPEDPDFEPSLVLQALRKHAVEPQIAMSDFARWIEDTTKGHEAIEIAAPIKFDGMFTAWYFGMFYEKPNPLSYGGDDIGSWYRGMEGKRALLWELGIEDTRNPPHNALEDAIHQAKEFEEILRRSES